ncbi:hypothetical protein DWY50_19865, partial [Ruminococcus sp. AF25-28AC]
AISFSKYSFLSIIIIMLLSFFTNYIPKAIKKTIVFGLQSQNYYFFYFYQYKGQLTSTANIK